MRHTSLFKLVALAGPLVAVGAVGLSLSMGPRAGASVNPSPPRAHRLTVEVFVHPWGLEVAGQDPELEGRVVLDDPAALTPLLSELQGRYNQGVVYVEADPDVAFGEMLRVLDAARAEPDSWPVLTRSSAPSVDGT
jgi:hypothetical protein